MIGGLLSPNLTGHRGSGRLCCFALLSALGNKVFLPDTSQYNESLNSYWSQQAASVEPACIFTPETTEDVSIAVQILTVPDLGLLLDANLTPSCPFAVRSGGHTSFAGAASIEGGVTVDLRALNSIELNEDLSVASVGAGAKWKDVYSKLDPLHLAVLGGRAGDIGVGGFTTGGGISYFSPRFGWACDMVLNYQVVLAGGSIVDAKDVPGLLAALRGGSNNFGIVTRVDLQTFDQGLVWGGHTINPISTFDAVIDAFVEINSADVYDPYASLITTFGVSQAMVPSLQVPDTVKDIPGIVWSIVLEPLPPIIYKKAPERSSSLDLSDRTKPLVIVLLSATWEEQTDDDLIDKQAQTLIANIDREAHRLNAHDPFIYLNYAAPWQDPIATYGDKSIKRLCEVRDKVDPSGVFTHNVPGGFKVICHAR
ncbi:putative fad- protein [Eutypa lata UCREL1]|uniref:Putative fad-protein n=1 Tax=Eutypa lata (strain UCR-EL1) TaxID=1287681 RepID=M7T6D2_EUTLA|nr:putative fad- protein [Eutypa lata UCREL1]